MIKLSLILANVLKNNEILKKVEKNIYFNIKYPSKKIMIVDDNLDFNFLNDLLKSINLNYLLVNLKDDHDLDEFILEYSDLKGNINKDYLFFKTNAKNIKKYASIFKPEIILVNETSDIIDILETEETFNKTKVIALDKYDFGDIKFSLTEKCNYFISNIDYIKEIVRIEDNDINVNSLDETYLKEILMFYSLFKEMNFDINSFNRVNHKNFSYEDKKIFLNIKDNSYNEIIKFISRYSDYKVIVIALKNNFEDISWLYNIEFERLINKNVQKIYAFGINAFDIATRIKYSDFNKSNIIASSNIDAFIKEIKNYNLNVYVVADDYFINKIKGENYANKNSLLIL